MLRKSITAAIIAATEIVLTWTGGRTDSNTYGSSSILVDEPASADRDGRGGKSGMIKYDPEIHEPRTGWDAIGIDMRIKEGHKLFVEKNERSRTADKKIYAGKIRKEEQVC